MSSGETGFESNRPEAAQVTAGDLLRVARERSGLHHDALAVMLKVPVNKLEALETSRFDLLPDMVFARALASSICRTLKIDAAPILELLPQTSATSLAHPSNSVNTPFKSSNDAVGTSMWSRLPKPAFVAVALLLLASLVVAFLPAFTKQFSYIKSLAELKLNQGNASTATAATTRDSGVGAVELKSETVLGDVPFATSASAGSAVNAALAAGTRADSVAAPSSTSPDSADSMNTSVPVTGVVVFRAVGESWVEVVDAKKQTVLRRTMKVGESVGVTGALPLSVTVGRANMTQVEVRGQPFDLALSSKENVARFEVK